MKKLIFTFILFFVGFNYGYSQDITGTWYGITDFPGASLRIAIHVTGNESGYSATIDSPDQDAFGMPADTLIISANEFRLNFNAQSYRGLISKDSQSIAGQWKYPGGSAELNLGREPIEPPKGSIVYIKNQYDKAEEYITMRDGVRLFTSVYSPKDNSEAHPILIVRTPYNIEPRGEGKYSSRLLGMTHLLDEKYIIVFQDVRGRFMSEGKFMDVRPFLPHKKKKEIDENSDTFDTIDWLIKNVANNNGKAGIFGISYPGFYSTMSLPEAHPALKAVSPQAPVSDWFIGDDWHHNGAFFLMDAFNFYSTIGRPRPEPTRKYPSPFQFNSDDNYNFFMELGPVKNVQKKYFGDSIQFWPELMSHPNYDDFWKKRSPLPYLKNIKPAVLVVGGWFDAEDLYGPLHTYKSIETMNPVNKNRLVMGPWYHGQWASGSGEKLGNIHFGSNTADYFQDLELAFFNYFLKEQGEMNLREATIFITGSNQWKGFDSWPPTNVEKRNLFLLQNGKLSFEPPTVADSFDEYESDPGKPVPYTEDVHWRRTIEYLTDDQRFASRRPDVMVYETGILEDDITLVGPVNVDFFVSTTGTDADYVVKVIDVFPDQVDYPTNEKEVPMGGYQMLVRGEVLRGKFRNSFENPEPFVPDQVTKVSFEIPDLAHTFMKGHKIMIQVQNSWFPLVDRNPQQFLNIYACDENDFIKATHKIFHDERRPSSISVNVLKE